ncbi:alpha/beta-glucosidase agdC [Penicillium manginii]|uniref:alpha/beta-glucosidase agdC n=1 Tax=Penicillium manginii TaxID=203109 RepID=UPI00254786DB|nr:alpha/beta-glucosidase agdC [Penicillium manginii]KAJ5743143.1 alpha/beta-glucosidase agdC [Penicillium manginii]
MRGGVLFLASLVGAMVPLQPRSSNMDCPGYKATNVNQRGASLEADLTLAGDHCDSYGTDLENLKLLVEYQTDDRLHVMIYDADEEVYQVPKTIIFRPPHRHDNQHENSNLRFDFEPEPFSFRVLRGDDVLFDTSDTNLIFQSQYLNLRTWLPENPHLYGLGEHIDSLQLPTKNYTRTLWSRDSYGLPELENLYGNHPVYVDHRGDSGTHGVFFLNSNGMDIKIDQMDDGRQYLEYNTLGGVFDFYFMAGPTPKDVSKQYAGVVGLPAMQSYWSFGFHNCRYGYQDIYEVAEAVYNYSHAHIPLETMWTDIDYMDRRRVFTLDPERFPLGKVRELVHHLHQHHQHYIMMVDPAISDSDNEAFQRGVQAEAFLQRDGELYNGAVWPGLTVYPDWFSPGISGFWNGEFRRFFSAQDGIDIDGLWIDMNEASNFCPWPCKDPEQYAKDNNLPPTPPAVRSPPRPIPGFPQDFQPPKTSKRSDKRRDTSKRSKAGLPGRNLIDPPYKIANGAGSISNKTIDTDIIHTGERGYAEYDTHNLYGTMMSSASREAMENLRPFKRPLVITRSTFAGAGKHVGHWLGDNLSQWDKYRRSIAQMLAFASIFQIPMIGSDVCGFGGNTTEELCARWAMLGGFYPFFRNHNSIDSIPQEFYRWPVVAEAARKIIDIRYRLLDYLYTAFHRQSETGEPFLQPLFYLYPGDARTFGNEAQFFYGDAILVSPVVEAGATSVEAYFPDDRFYDWFTGKIVQGMKENVELESVSVTDIPIHIRGGSIIPLRSKSAMTTTELRRRGFEILVAPNPIGYARGELYLDDGETLVPNGTSLVQFEFVKDKLSIRGQFGYQAGVVIESVTVLGQNGLSNRSAAANQTDGAVLFDEEKGSVTKKVTIELNGPVVVEI